MKMNHQLTVTIPIFDRDGRKIGEKEVVTYRGLLAKAHDEGLREITTELIQAPTKENGEVAIVRAVVKTNLGVFTGIGDAHDGNVNKRIAAHLIRMAETRAKARALRDAVNIGVVALEELGELIDDGGSHEGVMVPSGNGRNQEAKIPTASTPVPKPASHAAALAQSVPSAPPQVAQPVPSRGDFQLMTEAQRRMLFRLAGKHGVKPEEAKEWLEKTLGIESLKNISRADASRAIDKLQAPASGNGGAQVSP